MTTAGLIRDIARRLRAARLHYGHGTSNARDEAAWLVGHAIGVTPDALPAALDLAVSKSSLRKAVSLADRRIRERVPLAYLLREAWIGPYRFYVDRRVIVPRSYIGELILGDIGMWLPARPRAALDLCTGSGCLGILLAKRFPACAVDLADVAPGAIAVAGRNIGLHRVRRRVRAFRGDLFDGLPRRKYDLIVANPPYVNAAAMRGLPREYRLEPRLALAGGDDGLDLVRRILRGAAQWLTRRGVLICEIGHNRKVLERTWPRTPFTWIATSTASDRVFVLERRQLPAGACV